MKQLVFVLSFCTFTYGFLLPGYLTLKDPLPDYSEDLRIGSPMEDLTTMKILIRKFHNLFQINKVQPMPFSWQDIPKFNTGVFTPIRLGLTGIFLERRSKVWYCRECGEVYKCKYEHQEHIR